MPHDIFISYSTANQAWAESALQLFETQGFSCWMAPRDIRPGSTWAAEIVHGISNARVMLLLLSSASNQSRQVAREVQLADSSRLRIVPVLLEPVQPEGDFIYFISNTQWLTALGGTAADHSTTLLAAVREALEAAATTSAAQSSPETLHISPSPGSAQNVPPPPQYAPPSSPQPRPAPPPSANLPQYSPPAPAPPLASRPLFWMLLVVGVLLVGGIGYLIFRSPAPAEDARREAPVTRPEPGAAQPQPPSPALAGTWKGTVGEANTITLQITVQPGDRIVVLVDNVAAKTVREPAQVLVAHQGFLEMDMGAPGQPPRARCHLRLSPDRRSLEGTWTQNKTKKTFEVAFAKVD